jgi:hypothetical protein
MKEDWFWTGEDVWTKKDGYFCQIDEPKYDKERLIGGIRGSYWATPIIKLIFEQDDFVEKDVYTEGIEMKLDMKIEKLDSLRRSSEQTCENAREWAWEWGKIHNKMEDVPGMNKELIQYAFLVYQAQFNLARLTEMGMSMIDGLTIDLEKGLERE